MGSSSSDVDGYFEQDASLTKTWKVYREQSLHLAWEVFNVSNSVRFDTSAVSSLGGLNTQVTSGAGFGIYSSPLVQSRKQQFSLRYDFYPHPRESPDCTICHTALHVVQPSVVLPIKPVYREHLFSFSHWKRPPLDQTAVA